MIKSEDRFKLIKSELQTIKEFPRNWGGRKQNNFDDKRINLFVIDKLAELKEKIKDLDADTQEYMFRRWCNIKSSECDEYLFGRMPGVTVNPDQYSKAWDLDFHGKFKLDLKSTRLPKRMWEESGTQLYYEPLKVIDYMYSNQSTEGRYGMQPRLFLIMVDEQDFYNEMLLRFHYESKEDTFRAYAEYLKTKDKLIPYKNVYSDIIYLVKRGEKAFYKFASKTFK